MFNSTYDDYREIIEDYFEFVPNYYLSDSPDYALMLDKYFYYLWRIEKEEVQNFMNVGIEYQSRRVLAKTGDLLGLVDVGYKSSLSENNWRQIILWLRDLFINGVSSTNFSLFLEDRFGISVSTDINSNPQDWIYNETHLQNRYEFTLEYDTSSTTNFLTSGDVYFIVSQLSRLQPFYILSLLVFSVIIPPTAGEDTIHPLDFSLALGDSLIWDNMTFHPLFADAAPSNNQNNSIASIWHPYQFIPPSQTLTTFYDTIVTGVPYSGASYADPSTVPGDYADWHFNLLDISFGSPNNTTYTDGHDEDETYPDWHSYTTWVFGSNPEPYITDPDIWSHRWFFQRVGSTVSDVSIYSPSYVYDVGVSPVSTGYDLREDKWVYRPREVIWVNTFEYNVDTIPSPPDPYGDTGYTENTEVKYGPLI